MTITLLIVAVGLLAVAFSVGRAAWRGEFDRNPFVPMLLAVCGVGAGAAIFLVIGGG